MKKIFLLLLFSIVFVSCTKKVPKVLLFITDGSRDLEYMLPMEAVVMKEILEQSNFDVVVTSLSGESISADSLVLKPDLKLSEINSADYSGFIFPCMAPPWEKIYDPNEDVVSFIKRISSEGKPMAAQTLSVADFAKAGVLIDKKYAFTIDPNTNKYPEFKGSIYSGEGVIQDGNIMTSGTCPWKSREHGVQDGTQKLTQLFVEAIKENIN